MTKESQQHNTASVRGRDAPVEADGPLVSVLIPTFNRRRYLSAAIASVVAQNYRNLEIFVINDGGRDVSDVVDSFGDERIKFINRRQNRGKAYSLNEALSQATGKYVCYLDDDDLYYPNHVQTLVEALEADPGCGAAYSDLYKAHCHVLGDGTRQVLSKNVEISRDFDRFFLLYFNHVLHVSLMHRRDLLEKTGPYNENVRVLIDWDMTRRLAFFTDFKHVYDITGQFYGPVGQCDRISVEMRKDRSEYLRNVLAIRSVRPPKPWPKMQDMAVILLTDSLDERLKQTLLSIWYHTFFPYRLYICVRSEAGELRTEMPNAELVPAEPGEPQVRQVGRVLAGSDADFAAIVPAGLNIEQGWVEGAVYALMNSRNPSDAIELEASRPDRRAAIFKRAHLQQVLAESRTGDSADIRSLLNGSKISLRRVSEQELPFKLDTLLRDARAAQSDGDWAGAARIYEYIREHSGNELWMKANAANAYYQAGAVSKAVQLSREVNACRPTASTLLIEARTHRLNKDYEPAIELLEKARSILEQSEAIWTLQDRTQ